MKELASNVAKALAKKADRSEVRKWAKEERENHPHYGSHQLSHQQGLGSSHQHGDHADPTVAAILHGSQYGSTGGYAGVSSGVSSSALAALSTDVVSLRREMGTLLSDVHDNKADIEKLRRSVTEEVGALAEKLSQAQAKYSRSMESPPSPSTPVASGHRRGKSTTSTTRGGGSSGGNFTEWRMALGDLSLNLRRELTEKCDREEMHAALGAEVGSLEKRLTVRRSTAKHSSAYTDLQRLWRRCVFPPPMCLRSVEGRKHHTLSPCVNIAMFDLDWHCLRVVCVWNAAKGLARELSGKAQAEEISQVENALVDLRSKVAGELTGGRCVSVRIGMALVGINSGVLFVLDVVVTLLTLCCTLLAGVLRRWLWTNGKIAKDGWVPWDTEVQNAAPAMLLWRPGSTTITTRIPGLYK